MLEAFTPVLYGLLPALLSPLVGYWLYNARQRKLRRKELAEAEATGKAILAITAVASVIALCMLNKKTTSMSTL